MSTVSLKQKIIQWSKDLGFLDIKFARAERMELEADRLQQWLDGNNHGSMSYMENHFDKRVDPRKLVPGAQTVICLSYNYFTEKKQDATAPKVSTYAYGRDYHKVVKKKLKKLFLLIQEESPDASGRFFVDSAPILERDWARRAGLGWMGKNTLIIHPKKGSYFFLSEIILNLPITPDEPISDYCGTCTKCIDACPTDALAENGYHLDAKKCISYLTIESKNDIPQKFQSQMENWVYGCDICQDVCPWNRFSTPHNENDFNPKEPLLQMTANDWQNLTKEEFDDLFFGSPVKRAGYQKLKENINFTLQGEP